MQPPDEPKPEPVKPPESGAATSKLRVGVGIVLLGAIAFASGYLPKQREVRRLEGRVAATEVDLRLADLHRMLGVASHEAQRNNYEVAMKAANDFFDGCRVASSLNLSGRPRTANALAAYSGYRDEVLAQLAASDPAVKQRLAELYLAMDGVLKRRE